MENIMKYKVGGSVRDFYIGVEPKDFDYVVTGMTEEEMVEISDKRVGAKFPVFLIDGDEYAMARREVSTGPGYNDFQIKFDPNVTIEEDLSRRDFTMNSIAISFDDVVVDPFGGVQDIKNRVIRVLGNHDRVFVEDPIRVLRLARFAAQFPAFSIDVDTKELAKSGMLNHATPERVYKEFEKALMSLKPSNFFNTLNEIGHLEHWFPEVFNMIGVPQPVKWHAEGDAYTHTMMVLDAAAKADESFEVRFGALVHDFGKAITPEHKLPSHPGHEKAGVPLVNSFCKRLKVPNKVETIGKFVAEYHMHVHNVQKLNPKTFLKMWDIFKRHHFYVIDVVASVAFYDNEGRLPYLPNYGNSGFFVDMMERIEDADNMTRMYSSDELSKMKPERIINERRKMLIKDITDIKSNIIDNHSMFR